MSYTEWELHGPEITSCNCDFGCPCQFNALPTRGDCLAAVAGRVDRGHFGDVSLDGLHWAATFAWPAAVHEGNGQVMVVVDENADAQQREAMLTILSGGETEPGATVFNVFASTMTKVHDPVFAKIEFEADIEARRGRFAVPGLFEAEATPITNPVTGAEHRARVVLDEGFEYIEAQYASGKVRSGDPIPLQWEGRHCHLAMLHLGTHGQVR